MEVDADFEDCLNCLQGSWDTSRLGPVKVIGKYVHSVALPHRLQLERAPDGRVALQEWRAVITDDKSKLRWTHVDDAAGKDVTVWSRPLGRGFPTQPGGLAAATQFVFLLQAVQGRWKASRFGPLIVLERVVSYALVRHGVFILSLAQDGRLALLDWRAEVRPDSAEIRWTQEGAHAKSDVVVWTRQDSPGLGDPPSMDANLYRVEQPSSDALLNVPADQEEQLAMNVPLDSEVASMLEKTTLSPELACDLGGALEPVHGFKATLGMLQCTPPDPCTNATCISVEVSGGAHDATTVASHSESPADTASSHEARLGWLPHFLTAPFEKFFASRDADEASPRKRHRSASPSRSSLSLAPELRRLLDESLSAPEPPQPEETPHRSPMEEVQFEVRRILRCRSVDEILGGGVAAEQLREFRRLVRLLHPDKGLVTASDSEADLALRLCLAALRRARLAGSPRDQRKEV